MDQSTDSSIKNDLKISNHSNFQTHGLEANHIQNFPQCHLFSITQVVTTSDGQLIFTASDDYTIKVIDSKTFKTIQILTGHNSPIRSLTINSNDNLLASCGIDDKDIKIWDIKNHREKSTLTSYYGGSNILEFSPDSSQIVGVNKGKMINVWEIESRKDIKNNLSNYEGVAVIKFSSNGQFLAIGFLDGSIQILDRQQYISISKLKQDSKPITSLQFIKDDQQLISHSQTGRSIRFWDLKEKAHIKAYGGEFTAFLYSEEQQKLICGTKEKKITIIEVNRQKQEDNDSEEDDDDDDESSFQAHKSEIKALAFLGRSQSKFVSGGADRTVKLWDLSSLKLLDFFDGHCGPVHAIAISNNSKYVVSAGLLDRFTKLWETQTGKCIGTLRKARKQISSLEFSSNDNYILQVDGADIIVFNTQSQQIVHQIAYLSANSAHLSKDGNILMSIVNYGNMFRITEISSGNILHSIEYDQIQRRNCLFSFTTNRIIYTTVNEIVIVSFEKDLRIIQKLYSMNNIEKIAFSMNEKYLVAKNPDNVVMIWDFKTLRLIQTLNFNSNSRVILPTNKTMFLMEIEHKSKVKVFKVGFRKPILIIKDSEITSASANQNYIVTSTYNEFKLYQIQQKESIQ